MAQFLGRKIQVEFKQLTGLRLPKKIKWDEEEKKVIKVLSTWEEHSKEKNWRLRRHRVYYFAKCDDGAIYKFYWDRGSNQKSWFLVSRQSP